MRVSALLLLVAGAVSAQQPNVVLIMADDLGYGDVAYNGHPKVKTPALDALAREGVRLDRFYAAAPVCSPARARDMGPVFNGPETDFCPMVSPSSGQEMERVIGIETCDTQLGKGGRWRWDRYGQTRSCEGGPGDSAGSDHPTCERNADN